MPVSSPSLQDASSNSMAQPLWVPSAWDGAITGAGELTARLNDYSRQFWGVSHEWRLFGATQRSLAFWKQSLYLTQEVPLSEDATLQLRLSSSAFYPLLESVFGERSEPTTHGGAPSALETMVLDQYARHMGQLALEHLIDVEALETQESNATLAHLVWLLQAPETPMAQDAKEEDIIGKLILSLPLPAIRTVSVSTGQYSDWLGQQILSGSTNITLSAGCTSLSLADLQQLEEDDIVLLDQSDRGRLGFRLPGRDDEMGFPITTLTRPLPVHDEDDASDASRGSTSSPSTGPASHATMPNNRSAPSSSAPDPGGSSVWDHLQIDVHAEFAPTRIPLQQLKQMSEGLVVEVGDLLHNQVSLVANGKTLAQGELVIVGDKFGVLITGMGGPANASSEPLQLPAVQAGHQAMAHEAEQQPMPSVPGVDQSLVNQAYHLGLDVHQVAEMAQQQGMDPEDALRQAIAFQQSQLAPPSDAGEEVARAHAMMDEVDRVLNENFDEE